MWASDSDFNLATYHLWIITGIGNLAGNLDLLSDYMFVYLSELGNGNSLLNSLLLLLLHAVALPSNYSLLRMA